MLCSNCATDLPDGSQFCLKCGAPQPALPNHPELPPVFVLLGCSKCGTNLPDGAAFCPKCGKPVSSPPKNAAPHPAAPQPQHNLRLLGWSLLVVVIAVIFWAAASESPEAQQVQEFVGWKIDRTILDTPFPVTPNHFQYYKFLLPEGSMNVAVVGQFSSIADSRSDSNHQTRIKDKEKDSDNNIEVYVLTEPAFITWQNGYAADSLYESGRVADGAVHADLPAGAGIYYLVFSNKFTPKAAKTIHATILLRYKSWLPEWLRHTKNRLLNWLGL